MNKTIEIEVTLFDCVKVYTVSPVEFTGVEDEAYAVMITRQAFISAGMPLARERWLEDNPKPEGVKLTDWYKQGSKETVKDSHFASAEEILAEAKVKATKALNREGGQNAALTATARLLGMTVEELLALKK